MKSLANAVSAKTARACDNCLKKRAHWYCAADNAVLCQSCDTWVHSANALARRHERLRLNNTSPDLQEDATWHQWFTRKPRTPRGSGGKRNNNSSTFHDVVPEISAEDKTDSPEVEEQLICQVPVVDQTVVVVEPKIKAPMMMTSVVMVDVQEEGKDKAESSLDGFLPTDMGLEDFDAEGETLLGRGLGIESDSMEELGLSNTEVFKVKNDMSLGIVDSDGDGATVPFDLNFGFGSQNTYEEDAIENVESSGECVLVKDKEEGAGQKNALMLTLNYDLVISTWGGQGLPWKSGGPPELDIDITGSQVVSMEGNGGGGHKKSNVSGCSPSSVVGDGGREARVSRYREKRRKRLFTKMIRYEVRKMHAEKRPRMKGRFVKRASLAASAGNSPLGVNN